MRNKLCGFFLLGPLWLGCFALASAQENTIEHDILFFPMAHLEILPKGSHNSEHEEFEFNYGSDIVYAGHYNRYRLLGELVVSNDEVELERLQFGLQLKSDMQLWIGRFHTPLEYWNSQYHHGVHLQSAVHRPGIVEYEDEGGPLTNHTSGAMLEANKPLYDGLLSFSFAVGKAPILKNQKLENWKVTDGFSKHKLHSMVRVVFQPDELESTQYGVFGSYTDITGEQEDLKKITQFVGGAYTYQDWNAFNITLSGLYIDNRIEEISRINSSGFFATYLHAEYELANNWIAYGRLERMMGGVEDLYLEYLDDPELERNLGGVRFDFTRRQAISSEVSKRINSHDDFLHISIQWSAVFP